MKKFIGFLAFLFGSFSILLGVPGEYTFKVFDLPGGWNGTISFNAVANSNVYDCNHDPTTLYHSAQTTTAVGGSWAAFDWFNDNSGYPLLAYGEYTITVEYPGKSAWFTFSLLDCYYSECGIDPPIPFTSYPMDMYFHYDFDDDKFYRASGGLVPISNGSTVGIWLNQVGGDPPGPCTDCFNPKVYLKNEYNGIENFGRLVVDENDNVESGHFINLPLNTSHDVRSEFETYTVSSNYTQQHGWNDSEDDIVYKKSIQVVDWSLVKKSNFEKAIQSEIRTNYLFGGNCNIQFEFKDPWKVEASYSRPCAYRSYSSGQSFTVFENENSGFNYQYPIYSLRVPQEVDDGNLIAVFYNWTINPSGGAVLSSSGPETDVVFVSDGVTVTANYYHWYRSAFQGSIPIDLTLNGNINMVGDVTVAETGNLVVQPSTVFKIAQNKIIRVYGDFTASGSGIVFKPVDPNYTIKNYWKGIYTYSTGKTILNNVRVEGANYGLYIYYGRGYVYHCTFYNNNYGLRILYPNSSFNIDRCTFTNNNTAAYSSSANVLVANSTFSNNTYGLKTYSSTGSILSNVLSNNSQGIAIYSGSLDFSTSTKNISYINNTIQNNSQYGIYIGSSAYPTLGEYYVDSKGYTHGGFNLFSRGTGAYDVYSLYASSIDARMNWWASNANRYGNFLIVPTADDGGLLKTVSQYSIENGQDQIRFQETMSQASQLISDSLFNEAISVYRTIISDYPHCLESAFALNGIVYSYYCLQHPEKILSELESLLLTNKGNLVEIFIKDFISTEYIKYERFIEASNLLDELLIYYEKYEMDEQAAYTLLNKTYLQQYLTNNLSIGKKGGIATQFKSVECLILLYSKYPNSTAASLGKEELGDDFFINEPLPEQTEVIIADHRIYPNPFNINTTVAFDLPEEAGVEIIVYDLMGREVWKSAKINYSAGTYSVIWHGVNQSGQPVGTGMYLVRLNSTKYNATQKVLLMK